MGKNNCDIEVADGVTLRFVNVTVPPTDKRINYSGGDTSRLLILRSNIRACDSDVFGFGYMEINASDISDPDGEAGDTCDVKEMFITGGANIVRSIMRSFGDGDFNIRVQSSTAGVTIRGSIFSSSDDLSLATVAPTARLEVLRSRLDSAATTEILGAGLTTVKSNRFNAVGGITVTGNPCIVDRNTPEVICTP